MHKSEFLSGAIALDFPVQGGLAFRLCRNRGPRNPPYLVEEVMPAAELSSL
jgi:hypothetical protein